MATYLRESSSAIHVSLSARAVYGSVDGGDAICVVVPSLAVVQHVALHTTGHVIHTSMVVSTCDSVGRV